MQDPHYLAYRARQQYWEMHPILRACIDALPPVGAEFPPDKQVDWLRMFSAAADYVYGRVGITVTEQPGTAPGICAESTQPRRAADGAENAND